MKVNGYLRMVLMFGENKAQTLYKNLERMITLVLYDVEKVNRELSDNNSNHLTGLTIVEIIDMLKSKYSLNFSDAEVLGAIDNRGQTRIIPIGTDADIAKRKFCISPEEFRRISEREKENKIFVFIQRFLEENKNVEFSETEMLELLNKHFYTVFNSNASTILDLINHNYEYTNDLDLEQFKFSTVEKQAINQFLYWDDMEKNKFVYEMVSCCFDYCMMTTKQNSSAFKHIFNQKVFYLDANIIFRLMGLNQENRRKVIDTFIKKCKEQKVKVRITNHARAEISDTIKYHVKTISDLLGNKSPISPKAVWSMSTWVVDQSFYQAYYDWCNDPINKYADYSGFERDLNKQANSILKSFEQKNFDSFSETDKELFYKYVESLTEYKQKKHRSTYKANIQTDVNNFMFVSMCNSQTKGNDFFSVHNYLISADHTFGEWAKSIRPGSIPIVVLPSVWYSIMLQYSGRSDDDYASFTSFLNFSLSNTESGGFSEWKLNILKRVIAMDEQSEIQSEIIYGIEEKLKNNPSRDLDSEQIDELIAEVHQGIVDREVAVAREEERRIAEDKIEAIKTETQYNISTLATKSQSVLSLAKAENERLKNQAEIDKKNAADAIRQGKEEAVIAERKRIVDIETEKQTKKEYMKYWIITICMVMCSLAVVLGIVFWISKQETLTNSQTMALNWLKYGFGMVAFVGDALIIGVAFKGLNREKIEESIRKRIEKEYDR